MLFARRQGSRELGAIAVFTALDFHELGYQRPTTAVEVSLDGVALRFEAKARFALLVRRNPVVRDEFAPVRRHYDPTAFGM